MPEKYKLLTIIIEGTYSHVSLYEPDNYKVNYLVREFITMNYPDIKLEKKGNFDYVNLVQKLLFDGWEPFGITSVSATSSSSQLVFGFRKRVET